MLAGDSLTVCSARGTFARYRESPEVRLTGRQRRESAVQSLPRHVLPDIPVSVSPPQHRPHALPNPPRCLQLPPPDRRQHPEHVLPLDAIHAEITQDRERVPLHAGSPVGRVLPVAPSRPQRLARPRRRLSEGGDIRPALLRERVAARPDLPPVVESLLPSLGERYDREAAQP